MSIQLNLPDVASVYRAFMPFVEGGGLFVATHDTYHLGEFLELNVHLLTHAEAFTVSGQIVWLTPAYAQGGRTAGIGIQFDADATACLLPAILTCLNDVALPDQTNDTM